MPDSEFSKAFDTAAKKFLSGLNTSSINTNCDDVIDKCIDNLIDLVNGHAAAVWLEQKTAAGDFLTIAYNIGEQGHQVEGVVSQPLDKGLVSKAYKEKSTVCHRGIFQHKEQSSAVDKELGQVTAHQIAVPFELFGKTVGAMTVIQTLAAGFEQHSEWGFDDADIEHFEAGVQVIQRLLELNIIRNMA